LYGGKWDKKGNFFDAEVKEVRVKPNYFLKRTLIDAPTHDVFRWHERDGALERLSPPWDPIKVIKRDHGIKDGACALLQMGPGPLKIRWLATHRDYEKNRIFRDIQVKGPFSHWVHTHKFYPRGRHRTLLEDCIEYKLPFHPLTRYLFAGLIRKKLKRIFTYRHETLAKDFETLLRYPVKQPVTIAITGASGLIGASLVPFLKTAGHRVKCFQRHQVKSNNQPYWNPDTGEINPEDLANCDVVIHLAGENIGKGPWSKKKKRRILASRIRSTRLISKVISELDSPPETFICASAIGYYGNRGEKLLTEEDSPGEDFISEVCRVWENSTMAAKRKGTRVIHLRIGIVLTPAGGALKKLMVPFKMGLGSKIGSGKQYMSWISIDDVLGAIYHIIMVKEIAGAVNLVSPKAVRNEDFVTILSKVVERSLRMKLSENTIKAVFGQMGDELLLSSTRVFPRKLLDSGYRFRYPKLEDALRHVLGKRK